MKKTIIVVVIIGILCSIVAFIMVNKMEENKPVDKEKANIIINDEYDINNEQDISPDENQDTIEMEGELEGVETSEYSSTLGYSMKYEKDKIVVSKDGNADMYKPKDVSEVYYKVELYKKSYEEAIESLNNKDSIIINGYDATFSTEIEGSLVKDYYYIKSESGVYVISMCYPNEPEYIEGWASRMKAMIQTFEIDK